MAVLLAHTSTGGVVVIRRGIAPHLGELALPGGFCELGETWQEACVRELHEETSLVADSADVVLFDVASTPANVLIFGALSRPVTVPDSWAPTDEATELVVVTAATELAFPLHTSALLRYLAAR